MISLDDISLNEKGEAPPRPDDNGLTKKVKIRKEPVEPPLKKEERAE